MKGIGSPTADKAADADESQAGTSPRVLKVAGFLDKYQTLVRQLEDGVPVDD